MTNDTEFKKAVADWPVNFEDVEVVHLMVMLKMIPAQRPKLAEELLDFAVLAGAVSEKGSDPLSPGNGASSNY